MAALSCSGLQTAMPDHIKLLSHACNIHLQGSQEKKNSCKLATTATTSKYWIDIVYLFLGTFWHLLSCDMFIVQFGAVKNSCTSKHSAVLETSMLYS